MNEVAWNALMQTLDQSAMVYVLMLLVVLGFLYADCAHA